MSNAFPLNDWNEHLGRGMVKAATSPRMRSSPRFRFSAPAFINRELVILLTFWVAYLAIMMTYAGKLQERFGIHPVITVAGPTALCYCLGWLWITIERRRHGRPSQTTSRRGSVMGAGVKVLVLLLVLIGLAALVLEGVVAIIRALA